MRSIIRSWSSSQRGQLKKVQVTIYYLWNFRLEAIESSLKNSAEESNKRVVESEVNSKQ